MTRLVVLLFAAVALVGCGGETTTSTPLLVFERVSAERSDTMTIYPDGRTEMNHAGHVERLTFEPSVVDELRAGVAAPIVEASVIGDLRHLLTIGDGVPIEIAVDEGSFGALLVTLLETHAAH